MENVNDYRIVVICGSDDDDGLIRYFGTNEEYRFHLEGLKDYLYTYYNDLAKKINADDLRSNEEIIFYLNTLGNIVFLNSPGYGLLFIPKEVTEKQIESLYDLLSNLNEMSIYIDDRLAKKHDNIWPEEIIDNGDLMNNELLDRLFMIKPYIKKNVKK